MTSAHHRGLALAALAAVTVLTGCASAELEARKAAEVEAARVAAEVAARTPKPINLDPAVADAAAVYLTFVREVQGMRGGFGSPEAVQAALRKSATYNPEQISRGLVAYASIVALQSPEFVTTLRAYAANPDSRAALAAAIAADPRQASYLDGAQTAAGLVTATLREDIKALGQAAHSVENDAYAIQAAYDPRQPWARTEVADREGRLAMAKTLSGQTMPPAPAEARRLLDAARLGEGVPTAAGEPRRPPHSPVVVNALALAALAVLDSPEAGTLQQEPVNQRCLEMSKLNFYQCLAASRPSYEDIFCVGRHAIRDLAVCISGASMPAAVVTVSGLTTTGPAEPPAPRSPIIVTQPPAPAPAPTPAPPRSVTPMPPAQTTARPAASPTERLNTQPSGSPES